MEWKNLKESRCPTCNGKLQFRLAGSKNSIKSRSGVDIWKGENSYFCFKCDFQISDKKLKKVINSINQERNSLLGRGGYLGY